MSLNTSLAQPYLPGFCPPEVAGALAAPHNVGKTGAYADLFELASVKTFITGLAGHVAAEAAR